MADVSERRVRPIQEAVDSKNWRQALQLCEKWHKKGEKSDRFQALRAYVLAKQQDASSTKRGRDEIVQLCNRHPALTDIDAICQIQAALNDLSIEDAVGRKLWERAAGASPEDKDLAMTWLETAIEGGDWQSAQKATMALRRLSPNDRNYEFWTAFMCYLIHEDQSVPERERGVFGTLAYRILSKAAAATVPQESEELLSPGKSIQSPEELSLLVRVYLNTGHVREVKELLMDSNTVGPHSKLFKLDHDLHRALQLEVLHAAEDWPAVLNELRMALKEPAPKNLQTSSILRTLYDAVEGKSRYDLLPEMRECLEHGLKVLPDSRDVHYGLLRILHLEKANDLCTGANLTDFCKQYFSKWCDRLSCFDELRGPVEVLDAASQKDFLDLVRETWDSNTESWTAAGIPALNAAKLDYCLVASHQTAAKRAMQDFCCKIIKSYGKLCATARASGTPAGQMAIVACMALLRASQSDGIDSDLEHVFHLQGGFLLHYCLTRFKDEYPALAVLTRILSLLGAISLSATTFKKLRIKNLQWENAGHLLLTRLSTLHPQRSKGSEATFNPLEMLDHAMTANADSVRSVKRLIMVGLQSKSYVSVMEAISLREDVKESFSKQLYLVESARAKRLRGVVSLVREPLSSGPFVDRRDFSFIPSFEHGNLQPFEQHLEAGPRPKDGWLRVMKICNRISDLVYQEHDEPQSIRQSDVEEMAAALEDLPGRLLTAGDELTKMEIENCNLRYQIGRALTLRLWPASNTASAAVDADRADLDDILQRIQDWLDQAEEEWRTHPHRHVISVAEIPIAPSWRYLHSAVSMLESLQTISVFVLTGSTKGSVPKSKSKAKNQSSMAAAAAATSAEQRKKELQASIERVEKCIHDVTAKLRANLNGSGVLGHMVDVVFGRGGVGEAVGKEMEGLGDAETVAEEFCGQVRDSWEDALDGLLAIGVKRSR